MDIDSSPSLTLLNHKDISDSRYQRNQFNYNLNLAGIDKNVIIDFINNIDENGNVVADDCPNYDHFNLILNNGQLALWLNDDQDWKPYEYPIQHNINWDRVTFRLVGSKMTCFVSNSTTYESEGYRSFHL